jgi:hypothetical protein
MSSFEDLEDKDSTGGAGVGTAKGALGQKERSGPHCGGSTSSGSAGIVKLDEGTDNVLSLTKNRIYWGRPTRPLF